MLEPILALSLEKMTAWEMSGLAVVGTACLAILIVVIDQACRGKL